ncbi:MAG: peptidylprolyl isomerase [Rhodobacteraceae bacterium]|nr:peptidylprolyl isomerase [Paracoccaceae bacterium]
MKLLQIMANLTVAAGLLASAANAQSSVDSDVVVATVNGEEIKMGHVVMVYDTLPQQYKSLPAEQVFQGIVEQIIQQTVLAQAAANPNSKYIEFAVDNERRILTASQMIDEITTEATSEDKLQAYYDARYQSVDLGREYNASHILVESEEEAKDLIVKLSDGADFAALAQEFSTGPSGPNGGAIGWFGQGRMVAPFEQAVMSLTVGEVSPLPVQTQFGWHVIILNDMRAVQAPAFEEVSGEIAAELQRVAIEERVKVMVDGAAVVRVDQSTLNVDAVKTDISELD